MVAIVHPTFPHQPLLVNHHPHPSLPVEQLHHVHPIPIWFLTATIDLPDPIRNHERCLQQAPPTPHFPDRTWPTRQQRAPPISAHMP